MMMMMMIMRSPARVVQLVLVLACVGLARLTGAVEQEIFLPPDCDVLKIVGNGFKLELSQFDAIKKDFKEVAEESSRIAGPRDATNDHESSSEPGDEATSPAQGGAESGAESGAKSDASLVNENLFERTQKEQGRATNYGPVEDDLMRWIGDRATSLLNRVQRYNAELELATGGNRIVLDILLLNTLVDLDNLVKEEVANLRWIKSKLQKLLSRNVHKEVKLGEVQTFVATLIDRNKHIESSVSGRNEPGKSWVTNTQALKRVLHEQRFSETLSKTIVEYLAGRFSMMKRSVVYELNRQPKQLDDGLYYLKARGRVPADFPFSAQDAISHGAYN